MKRPTTPIGSNPPKVMSRDGSGKILHSALRVAFSR